MRLQRDSKVVRKLGREDGEGQMFGWRYSGKLSAEAEDALAELYAVDLGSEHDD